MGGYPKKVDPLAAQWFDRAVELEPGQEILVPLPDMSQFNSLRTHLYALRKEYAKTDTTDASRITFARKFVGGVRHLQIKKQAAAPVVGLIKNADGSYSEVSVSEDSQRSRMLLAMKEDGLTLESVEEKVGKLTEKEKKTFRFP